MRNKIRTYLINLYYALLNKPIIKVVDTEHVVIQPLNKQQIQYMEKLFPRPVYKEGMSITEVAYKTGMFEVVEFIKAWSARGGKLC